MLILEKLRGLKVRSSRSPTPRLTASAQVICRDDFATPRIPYRRMKKFCQLGLKRDGEVVGAESTNTPSDVATMGSPGIQGGYPTYLEDRGEKRGHSYPGDAPRQLDGAER